MDNLYYLQSNGITDPEAQQKCLKAMEKYGSHKWWEPDVDARAYAYHQINEDTYLSEDARRFGEALTLLLGRPIHGPMVELHPANLTFLRAEAERAWRDGTPSYTREEIEQIHLRLFARMQGWGEKVLVVEIPE